MKAAIKKSKSGKTAGKRDSGYLALYRPIDNFDLGWGLKVVDAGYTNIRPGDDYPARHHPAPYMFEWETGRRLSNYQIVFIGHGRGVIETERGGRGQIEAGDVFILFPGEWHRYRPRHYTTISPTIQQPLSNPAPSIGNFNPSTTVLQPPHNHLPTIFHSPRLSVRGPVRHASAASIVTSARQCAGQVAAPRTPTRRMQSITHVCLKLCGVSIAEMFTIAVFPTVYHCGSGIYMAQYQHPAKTAGA